MNMQFKSREVKSLVWTSCRLVDHGLSLSYDRSKWWENVCFLAIYEI